MAEEPDNEQATPEAPVAEARKPLLRRMLVPASGALLSTALAVVFAAVVVPVQPEGEGGEEEVPEKMELDLFEPPQTVEIGQFKVTLADEGREGFARIDLALEFRAKDPPTVLQRLGEELRFALHDELIIHLSGKLSADLKSTEGKQILKLELIDVLSPLIFEDPNDGVITNLFYKDFLVQ